jgi:hypothetical protein
MTKLPIGLAPSNGLARVGWRGDPWLSCLAKAAILLLPCSTIPSRAERRAACAGRDSDFYPG